MKKLLFSIAFMMLSVIAVFADSPLTSTEFFRAYLDVPIVKQASQSNGVLSDEMMNYLANDMNPIDKRMALVNALGFGHKENDLKYSNFLHATFQRESDASPKVMSTFLYLQAMAFYDDDSALMRICDLFKKISVDSRICSICSSLVYAQIHMDSEGAMIVRDACYNKYSGVVDCRDQVFDIVMGYMKLYEPNVIIKIHNKSSNPYSLDIDGNSCGRVSGNGTYEYECDGGRHRIIAKQISGYMFSPTTNIRDVNAENGNTYDVYVGFED